MELHFRRHTNGSLWKSGLCPKRLAIGVQPKRLITIPPCFVNSSRQSPSCRQIAIARTCLLALRLLQSCRHLFSFCLSLAASNLDPSLWFWISVSWEKNQIEWFPSNSFFSFELKIKSKTDHTRMSLADDLINRMRATGSPRSGCKSFSTSRPKMPTRCRAFVSCLGGKAR